MQGCVEVEGRIIRLGGPGVILKVDQVRAAIEPGEELFPPGQAGRFTRCEFGGVLEIHLRVTLRAKDGMNVSRAPRGEDNNISEVEVPPELTDEIIGNAPCLSRTFVRIIDQELTGGVIVSGHDLVMTQPDI